MPEIHVPSRGRRMLLAVVTLGTLAAGPAVHATVVEPNGLSVPAILSNGETTLPQFFTAQGESIDAVRDAAISPAVFLPLCDFQAKLVLSQSSAQAGLAWYNVPADPTAVPATHLIGTPPLTLGQSITSADIRTDPNYTDGLIGFALMKNLGNGYVPVYYSEFMRNADCTGCVMPGHWKMALSYQSKLSSNAYYMAWEDWEGADANSWQGNDGDFNDKVFFISGVTCDGGGVPCETGMQGVCNAGVTECEPGGTVICKPQVTATTEVCDNLDNDCNGQVDDGSSLCPANQVCVQGKCIGPCSDTEFPCNPPYVCKSGYCVDPSCVGVTCKAGQVCQSGQCVGGCDGVVCPLGQECQLGVCVDPCKNVSCPGAVCEHGACVTTCACHPCGSGQACAADGRCVDSGCEKLTCPSGQACRAGACVDVCTGAACPGGGACKSGLCQPPTLTSTGAGGSGTIVTGSGGSSTITTGAGGSGAGGSHPGGAAGSGQPGTAGSGGTTAPHAAGGIVGCSCRTAATPRSAWPALMLLALVLTARRRRALIGYHLRRCRT